MQITFWIQIYFELKSLKFFYSFYSFLFQLSSVMLAALQKGVHPVVQKCQSYHKELEVLHMQVLREAIVQEVVTAQEVTEAPLVVMVEVLVVSLEE
jgi:hypothetical protein